MPDDLKPWYHARDELTRSLEDELMGPAKPVALQEAPLNRIIVGVLHPVSPLPPDSTERPEYKEGMETEDSNTSTPSSEDSSTESAVALSHAAKPSSVGMTFAVDPTVTPVVEVIATARKYVQSDDGSWGAIEVAGAPHLLPTGEMARVDLAVSDTEPQLRLVGVVRRAREGIVRITLSLVNKNPLDDSTRKSDSLCYFRPRILVRALEGSFVDRRGTRKHEASDPDTRSSNFLYRDVPALAVGHGCAATWDENTPDPTELSTTFLPSHDVRLARPSGGDEFDPFGSYRLRMKALAGGGDVVDLAEMASAYERWIDDRRRSAESMDEAAKSVAIDHMDQAAECAKRIRQGIRTLDDPQAAKAFRLMNEAMVLQRDAQDKARGARPSEQEWRPFQIAFILMNLPALADGRHPDREVVDLLWFPTGGGKTEAYLGCIAFSVLLRRLRRTDDGGVSAIMRYTLRLLTRQQFERAAGLICALELIRRREIPDSPPISLGLWVGNQATPKDAAAARKILRDLAAGTPSSEGTPIQLLNCPWCGTGLTRRDYDAEDGKALIIRCASSVCEFADGLPCWVTDEDVYRERPSLIIGTVDKFAMMSWRSQVADLLSVDGPHSRPDLIVQDELHLISGPLGTMVGLYESALDLACTDAGRPKVLASTATIRRAQQQVKNVFDRASVQFPPPGLDPGDNYFAVEATAEQKGTRRYVGVMAPGTSQATLLVRLYASLLQAASELDTADEVRDSFWTMLGYFNSLRVLGSTYLQVLDDVPDRLQVVAARHDKPARTISQEPVELTSRVDQTRIPAAMGSLETSYPSPHSPDVVLATNMISVGLDIDRLGLMVVAGQPQSASEYIQSTSRVGRRRPGLVVVALNAQRSRDASHYESFVSFHRALYREVEATTATPFAPRARDRGAHGTLVAAIRLLVRALRDDASAPAIDSRTDEVSSIVDRLVERARRVAPEEADAFRDQLEGLVGNWVDAATGDDITEYGRLKHPGSRRQTVGSPLMRSASEGPANPSGYPVGDPAWPTLTSMRDVDAETRLVERYLAREAQSHGVDEIAQG